MYIIHREFLSKLTFKYLPTLNQKYDWKKQGSFLFLVWQIKLTIKQNNN